MSDQLKRQQDELYSELEKLRNARRAEIRKIEEHYRNREEELHQRLSGVYRKLSEMEENQKCKWCDMHVIHAHVHFTHF